MGLPLRVLCNVTVSPSRNPFAFCDHFKPLKNKQHGSPHRCLVILQTFGDVNLGESFLVKETPFLQPSGRFLPAFWMVYWSDTFPFSLKDQIVTFQLRYQDFSSEHFTVPRILQQLHVVVKMLAFFCTTQSLATVQQHSYQLLG